jgi:hypothetical protein
MRVLMLLFLAGCPEVPKGDDTAPIDDTGIVSECEEDGDGYCASEGDCDDSNADVNPGAPELCDGIDNDCDWAVDEGVTATFYADTDNDGFGDPDVTTESCDTPSGYTTTGTDCDDAEATVYPNATELCDTLDNDCDGDIDEGVETVRYTDADGDGYGDVLHPIETCEALEGTVPNADDCDDVVATVHPGAEELCNDIDDDCNGAVDDDPVDTTVWHLDFDGDGYGGAAYTADACDAPAGYVASADDCDDADVGVYPGATEVCDEVDQDCDGAVDEDLTYTTWYDDGDADGYGAGSGVSACSAPPDAAENAGDCDDADAAISPSEPEDCNGIDDDCSGAIDDGGVCPCDVVEDGVQSWQLCTDAVTWSNASTACRSQGWTLATIDDASEDAFLRAEIAAYSSGYYWWIGYTDGATEGSWLWTDGSGSTYTNWGAGEPNDLDGEDCGTFTYSGAWNDWECTNSTTYICEP